MEKESAEKKRLQMRMTGLVSAAVILVSAIILAIMVGVIRGKYEDIMDTLLEDDIVALSNTIEQRMFRVEDATNALASVSRPILSSRKGIDSLILRGFKSINEICGLSLIFRKGFIPGEPGYYERYAKYDKDGNIILDSFTNGDELDSNPYWNCCFTLGSSFWGRKAERISDGRLIAFYNTPLTAEDGERIGMAYSVVHPDNLTSFVRTHKAHKEIDFSIFMADGTMLVAPDPYILELSDKDLLTKEMTIKHLGWKIVLSADRRIIDRVVRRTILNLILMILVMFTVMIIAIKLTVRYVAKPFIEKQQKTEKDKAVMENELKLASRAQSGLVPHVFPPFPERKGISLSACLFPARDVGGDLYDYFLIGDKLYLCIGDVSGKGMQAALFMAATHYLFRSVAAEMAVSDAVKQMNLSLCSENEDCRFVTFWFGCLDLGTGKLDYVNAGHNAPVLASGATVGFLPASPNMPLGVMDDAEFISESIGLKPGDRLFLYTDGITEAMDTTGREFGAEKLVGALESVRDADAPAIIDTVLDKVRKHEYGTEQSDDITMLCLNFIKTESKH